MTESNHPLHKTIKDGTMFSELPYVDRKLVCSNCGTDFGRHSYAASACHLFSQDGEMLEGFSPTMFFDTEDPFTKIVRETREELVCE
jgi:hypothetical protein